MDCTLNQHGMHHSAMGISPALLLVIETFHKTSIKLPVMFCVPFCRSPAALIVPSERLADLLTALTSALSVSPDVAADILLQVRHARLHQTSCTCILGNLVEACQLMHLMLDISAVPPMQTLTPCDHRVKFSIWCWLHACATHVRQSSGAGPGVLSVQQAVVCVLVLLYWLCRSLSCWCAVRGLSWPC